MLLKPEDRSKLDDGNDIFFYATPRFVTHVDDAFLDQLTELYRQRLQPGTQILDLMSSWISHLPEDLEFAHVEGHGLNSEELARNPRLNHYFVQNLNSEPQLPLADQSFDAVLITVSVQYLQYPEAVFSEIYRVLKPGGVVIVSFSNRMFYQKAVQIWRDNSESGRVQLVQNYLRGVPGFTGIEVVEKTTPINPLLQLFGLGGADPFYAVIAYRL